MFYSQFILAKKGPLGTIWIAAHLERKLRKNQVADTDIGVSVDSILSPNVPVALRLSSHLLLGVVRIYSRKVNYLFDDCSETLLKVKQAFRSAAVDLPPEESKAPYHSITLPETFDLDDFELPDNDIFQGNFVDHHISSREQITLQDNVGGALYTVSEFGLDERFGDGDASGLDLDEELFLDKIGFAGQAIERSDPQASVQTVATLKQDEHQETTAVDSEIGDDDDDDDFAGPMDYAQPPSTPVLVEEPYLFNAQEVSDHLETERPLVESLMTESARNDNYGDKQEVNCSSHNNTNSAFPMVTEENGYPSDGLNINLPKELAESPIEANIQRFSLDETLSVSEPTCDLSLNLNLELASKLNDDHPSPYEIVLEKRSACEISESVSVKDRGLIGIEVSNSVEIASNGEKLCPDGSDLALRNQGGSLNLDVHEKVPYTENLFLRRCDSNVGKTDMTSGCVMSTEADVQSDVAALEISGREEMVKLGQESRVIENFEETLKEIHIQVHASHGDVHAASSEPIYRVHNAHSHVENLNNSTKAELLPPPEKLLSVPLGHVDLNQNALVEVDFGASAGPDEGDAVSKLISGKKRTFTESTLTEQSLNSVESSRLIRRKRTVESVPDDDLLSSILVGRPSVLKVKRTPRLSKVTSMKRTRSCPRSGAPKRKVLMDDITVLHGDTIRQQLTNTEDIRRVRKKAPCTRPEISLIQNQYFEDNIFLEPMFTGTSLELVSLHNKTRDLSGITVVKNDLNDPPLESLAELWLPSENNENVDPLETIAEPTLDSHDVKNDHSFTTDVEAEPHATSENDGNDKCPRLSNNMTKEIDEITEEINVNADISQQEVSIDVTGVQTSEKNDNAVNSSDTARLEPLYSIGDASAGIGQPGSITETVDTTTSVNADTSAVLPDQKTDVPSVELDSAVMDVVDNGQAARNNELIISDTAGLEPLYSIGDASAGIGQPADTSAVQHDQKTDIPSVELDSAVMDVVDNGQAARNNELTTVNDGEIYNARVENESEARDDGEIHSVVSGERIVDGFTNNGETQEQPEVHERDMTDAQISSFDPYDGEELKYSAAGNDTEFLNVDDDELADDHIPDGDDDDEEARFSENTGWSSRTRAVSKYLQTLFVKEADFGRKFLSMDGLLIGKSRKEASRMFFESLVLKTRDYIHVEQPNPLDDITIKPRTRLMTSDF